MWREADLIDFDLIFYLIIELLIFLLLVQGLGYVIKFLHNKRDNRLFKVSEYIPEEEFHSIKQVYYLSIMTLALINILIIIIIGVDNTYYLVLFEIFLSIILIEGMPRESLKDKIVLFTLIPFASMMYILTDMDLVYVFDLVRIFGLFYASMYYYRRFEDYTETNSLGITILLLFTIIFISLFFTTATEHVNLLDSLVMVSNAFTSNGYAILGGTILGKMNAIFLVWSGYILSGVGTATLTATLIIKHYDKKFKELEELIKDMKKE